MPQYVNGKLVWMHGEDGDVPIGKGRPWKGGVFGQPAQPQPRRGVFTSRYDLPWYAQEDNTIGPDQNMLPDRYLRASPWPVTGVSPVFKGKLDVPLGDNGDVQQDIAAFPGQHPALVGAAIGLIVTAIGTGKKKPKHHEEERPSRKENPAKGMNLLKGAVLGAAAAVAGKTLSTAGLDVGQEATPARVTVGTLAGAVLGGWLVRTGKV